MRAVNRTARLAARIALLLALASTSAFLTVRTYLGDEETVYDQGNVSEVVHKGPVTLARVEWKLDSLQPYTTLVDKDGEEVSMDNPAGSTIVVASVTLTPLDGLYMKEGGFTCKADLTDDRGNIWSGQMAFDYPLPTYCSDSDHPFTRNKPAKIAQIYVVPDSAVPHLTGVVIEDLEERRRILITP